MQELTVDQLGKIERFAGGGQAFLYRTPGLMLPGLPGPYVYKEYKPRVIEGRREAVRSTLRGLIRVREEAAPEQRAMIDGRAAWPLAVVVDDRGATGCLMREIPQAFFRTIQYSTGRAERVPWEWELYLQEESEVRARGLPTIDDARAMFLLGRVLQFAKTAHHLDVVVGDFSSANILVSVAAPKESRPMFVDVDSFRMASGVSALLQPHTPAWETPENQRNKAKLRRLKASGASPNEIARARAATRFQDKASDVYKAGLLIVRTLDGGASSSQLRRSSVAETRLRALRGKRNADLVLDALSTEPRNRPTMRQLADAFTGG